MKRYRGGSAGLLPLNKRMGKGKKARRARKIARRLERRKVAPSG